MGCHLAKYFSVEPYVYLIFSSLRKNIKSSNQDEADGGPEDYHDISILLRAKREENIYHVFCLTGSFNYVILLESIYSHSLFSFADLLEIQFCIL